MNNDIACLKNRKSPFVAIIGCLHGDELIGKRVISTLKKVKIKNGRLITIIGNERAVRMKRRFVNQDLNRSFPGVKNGNHEECLAHDLRSKLSDVDFVIDIHSTTTNVRDLAIITRKNKKTLELVNLFSPKRVALIVANIGKKALTYHCKAGISLEYGKDKDSNVEKKILRDIMTMLANLDMVDFKSKVKKNSSEFYKITGLIKKQVGFELNNEIKNFKIVKTGNLIALNGLKKKKAKFDFYPILFGKNSYRDIYGFAAEKVEKF